MARNNLLFTFQFLEKGNIFFPKMNKLEHTKFVPSTFFLKPILIGLVIIPISLALWIFGNIRSNYLSADGNKKLYSCTFKYYNDCNIE